MSDKLNKNAAVRALSRAERRLRHVADLLDDNVRPINGLEFSDAMETLTMLRTDSCFPLALLNGGLLADMLCAVAEANMGATKIAESRRWHGKDMRVMSELRDQAREHATFAATRISRLIGLVTGDPRIMR